MKPEEKVKKKIKDLLKKYDIWYFMPRGTLFGRGGIPDFICCINGRLVGIEAKAGNNKPSALQRREMIEIASHGGHAFCVNEAGMEELESFLNALNLGAVTVQHSSVPGLWTAMKI